MTTVLSDPAASGVHDSTWYTFWPWLDRQQDRSDHVGQIAKTYRQVDDWSTASYGLAGQWLREARLEHAKWYEAHYPNSPAARAEAERISALRAAASAPGSDEGPTAFDGDVARLGDAVADTLGLVLDLLYDCVKYLPAEGIPDRLWPKLNLAMRQVGGLKQASGAAIERKLTSAEASLSAE